MYRRLVYALVSVLIVFCFPIDPLPVAGLPVGSDSGENQVTSAYKTASANTLTSTYQCSTAMQDSENADSISELLTTELGAGNKTELPPTAATIYDFANTNWNTQDEQQASSSGITRPLTGPQLTLRVFLVWSLPRSFLQ